MDELPIRIHSSLPPGFEASPSRKRKSPEVEPAVTETTKKAKAEEDDLSALRQRLRVGMRFAKKDAAVAELDKLGDQEEIFVVARSVTEGAENDYWTYDMKHLLDKICHNMTFGLQSNYFEMFRAGKPVRLALDLEYKKVYNTDRTLDELCDYALYFVNQQLAKDFKIYVTAADYTIQDSSDSEKGSRHYELKASKAVFESTVGAVKPFMERVKESIKKAEAEGDERARKLYVTKKDSKGNLVTTSFVDYSIYKRDGLFRFVWNQKFKSTRILVPLEFQGKEVKNVPEVVLRPTFKAARVCVKKKHVDAAKANQCFIPNEEEPEATKGSGPAKKREPGQMQRNFDHLYHGADIPYREAVDYCLKQMYEKNPAAKFQKYIIQENGAHYVTYSGAINCCLHEGTVHKGGNNSFQWLVPSQGKFIWCCHACKQDGNVPPVHMREVFLPFELLRATIREYNRRNSEETEEEPAEQPIETIPSAPAAPQNVEPRRPAVILEEQPVVLPQSLVPGRTEIRINRDKLLIEHPQRKGEFLEQDLMPDEADTLELKSIMGSGKTEWLVNLIKHNPDFVRILSIVPSQTLATSQATRLIPFGFKEYRDAKKENMNLSIPDKLVTQLESIIHLKDLDKLSYDLLILDEIESLLSHFKSSTLNCKRGKVWELLMLLVRSAKKVVMLDADLGPRAHWFCDTFRTGKKNLFVNNTFQKRDKVLLIYECPEMWTVALFTALAEGKKVLIPTNKGPGFLMGLQQVILEKFPDLKILHYHAGIHDDIKKASANCNQIWPEYDVVMFTPTIQCGVDFSVPHFDCTFAYATSGSNTAREFMQQIGRARKNKTDDLILTVEQTPKPGYITISAESLEEDAKLTQEEMDQIFEKAQNDRRFSRDNGGAGMLEPDRLRPDPNVRKWFPDCREYLELFCYNAFEANRSKNEFLRCFVAHATTKGYKEMRIRFELPERPTIAVIKDKRAKFEAEEAKAIMEAPVLSHGDYLEIQDRIRKGQKRPEDQAKIDKHNIRLEWGLDDIKDEYLVFYWKEDRKYFHNARRLARPVVFTYEEDLRNHGRGDFWVEQNKYTLRRQKCEQLAALWGFERNIFDGRSMPLGKLTQARKKVLQEADEIIALFGLEKDLLLGQKRKPSDIFRGDFEPPKKLSKAQADLEDLFSLTKAVFYCYVHVFLDRKAVVAKDLSKDLISWRAASRSKFLELMASRTRTRHLDRGSDLFSLIAQHKPEFRYGDSTGVYSWTYYAVVPVTEPGLTKVDKLSIFWHGNFSSPDVIPAKNLYSGKSVPCSEVYEAFVRVTGGGMTAPDFGKLLKTMCKTTTMTLQRKKHYVFPALEEHTEEPAIDFSFLVTDEDEDEFKEEELEEEAFAREARREMEQDD